jgi:ParB family chromosome partitioning protein
VSVQINRLGKGLDALIPNIIPNTDLAIHQIEVDQITPNPYQPRQYFDKDALNELAHSIKTHGLAQPIIVRKTDNKYELIIGERRLEATKLIGHSTIPAIIKNINDKESCEIALVENIDRESLNVIEIGQSLKRLIDEFNYTQDGLSSLFSRSRSSIANILRLLKLPQSIQDLIVKNILSEGHARTLVEFSDNVSLCEDIAKQIIDNNLSVRQAEKLAKTHKQRPRSNTKCLIRGALCGLDVFCAA